MRTKIICTIGPASKSESVLTQMIKEGMSVARINFSHGTYKEIKERVNTIRKVSKNLRKNILIFADLQGPKIRIGRFKNDKVFLTPNQKFIITTKELKGDKNKVSVDYKELPKFIKPKDKLFLDDGKIELVVEKVKDEDIICKVIEGGVLSSRKGLTVKEKFLPLEPITQEDKKDIEFALSLGINWFAQSFVRKKEDVLKLKEYLRSLDKNKKFFVIAKIEDAFGYKNIDGILEVADGVMVARGDLGVSVERALVPIIQKEIIEKTNKAKKLDIIATQMLETMVESPHPTRAEVNDVAVAVMQGADYVMLSAETAVGRYPVLAVKEMKKIIETVEEYISKSSIKI